MKKEVVFLLITALATISLTCCGADSASTTDSTAGKTVAKDSTGIDYENPRHLMDSVYEVYFTNYCYGLAVNEENQWARNLGMYNTEFPLLELYVYPTSDEKILSQTATTLYQIDQIFADSKEYKKYCKKNGVPYRIDCFCLDEALGSFEFTGEHTLEEIEDKLSNELSAVTSKVVAPLDEFYEKVDTIDGLQRGEDGCYYFVLDTKNFDESSQAILSKIAEVSAIDPLPEDTWENYGDSQRVLGFLDRGFAVYADTVEEEHFLFSNNFNADSRYFLIQMFRPLVEEVEAGKGRHLLIGSAPEDIDVNNYYVSINSEQDGSVSLFLTLSSSFDDAHSREEITDYAVDFINDLVDVLAEHKIQSIENIGILADFQISDPDHIATNAFLPLNEHITVEEFNDFVEENGERYDPADYILPDDIVE